MNLLRTIYLAAMILPLLILSGCQQNDGIIRVSIDAEPLPTLEMDCQKYGNAVACRAASTIAPPTHNSFEQP